MLCQAKDIHISSDLSCDEQEDMEFLGHFILGITSQPFMSFGHERERSTSPGTINPKKDVVRFGRLFNKEEQ